MHVLVLPSWYPTAERPLHGQYLVEQMQAVMQRSEVQFGVAYSERRSPRQLSWQTLRDNWFQTTFTEEDGIPTIRAHSWNYLWRLPLGLRLRIREAKQLAERYIDECGRPDLIHAHSAQWAAAAAARVARDYDVPYVVTEHFSGFQRDVLPRWHLRWVRKGLRNAQHVAAVSTVLRDLLVRRELVDPERIRVLPNLVNETVFTLPQTQRTAPPVRFFALGHLNPRKGFDVLIEAFARAFAADDRVQLEIGGDGPMYKPLQKQVQRAGLSDRVRLLGRLKRSDVRRAFWRAHVFVSPSRHETFGLPIAEALATGLPVLATRSGGPADLVTPDTGQLVPTEDPDALARGLRDLLHSYAQYDPMALRRYAIENFGVTSFAQGLLSLYNDSS